MAVVTTLMTSPIFDRLVGTFADKPDKEPAADDSAFTPSAP
jgi:hypothetical protein